MQQKLQLKRNIVYISEHKKEMNYASFCLCLTENSFCSIPKIQLLASQCRKKLEVESMQR